MPYCGMLRVDAEGPVLRVAIDRSGARNALDAETIAALGATFAQMDGAVRAVVLTGSGDFFCAGGDLRWMREAADQPPERNFEDALRLARLFETIAGCAPLVVARINGPCYGGGCGLVAAADVAVAVDSAKFAFSEVRLGLVPATISTVVLPKIGAGHARALFATGEEFDAERALRIGLVHEVVSAEELDDAVGRKLAAALAAGPLAVGRAKRLALDPPPTLDAAARLLADTRAGEEAREGLAAFLQKRSPAYRVSR